ncbi:MAG TPA: acyl-[acyl-carrier-protein] thioesterase [Candidatus Enterocloster faecavium]|uniref:Acyl-[acyl-carrier-protein] thioesterase n=1 Tax=Candidatus Enterocloster faecavium TaxID=2838560 RepID=A0A9D2L8X9_9FIRM|nr:acyl-[acyl-carrier-protein] thioesterase [Candidatus Enterocloster faecavium]
MYSFDSRVRYSETDETGNLTVLGIINYMQDCSTFHSEEAGVGVQVLESRRRAWMLSSWQILIDRYPSLGEEIRISTWHNESRGIYGYRNFVISGCQGESLVRAGSVWFLYDLDKGTPTRVLPEDIGPYGKPEPKLELPPMPRRIVLPEEYQEGKPIPVLRHHLDSNHHVNNAQYVEMARELIPEQLTVREIRAEYRKAAVLGDVLYPRLGKEKDGIWVIALCKAEGEVCACVWLKTEPEG